MDAVTTPFVKICGLSTAASVDCAVEHGADAVGFVFAPGSPRLVTREQAAGLIARVPEHVETVGVFRNRGIDEVVEIARDTGVTTIQLHGSESYADVQRAKAHGFGVMRAFAVTDYVALSDEDRELWDAERLLIDAVEPGSGVPFDPNTLGSARPTGWWLLAGGLTPENVTTLIDDLQPTGVDVSSGVECTRGVKSLERIGAFLDAIKTRR